jgi:hypothetical protein
MASITTIVSIIGRFSAAALVQVDELPLRAA